MLSNQDIDTLLCCLDRCIQEEIRRICDPVLAPLSYERLITAQDAAFARSMGITLR